MKIIIEIDCTPEEARTFLGWPDVQPMQDALMQEMQKKMSSAMTYMDMEPLLKAWMPLGAQGLEAMQQLLWGAAEAALKRAGKDPA